MTTRWLCFIISATLLLGCGKTTTDVKKQELYIKRATGDMNAFLYVCEQFREDHGSYPSNPDDIYTLAQGGRGTNAYLHSRINVDPWGKNYSIQLGTNHPSIASAGPDGIWKSADDLRLHKPTADFYRTLSGEGP